jgi:hypothetical protein
MSDQEFISEIRRGLITIMRACVKRYGVTWESFLPAAEKMVKALDGNATLTYGPPAVTYHIMRDEARPE